MSQDGARFARRNRSVGSGVDGGTWREANIKKNWVYRAYFKLTKQFTETPLLLHPTALIGSPNRKKCSHCHQISVRHVNCGQWWHISSPQLRTLSQFEVYKWFYRNGETKLIFAVFFIWDVRKRQRTPIFNWLYIRRYHNTSTLCGY